MALFARKRADEAAASGNRVVIVDDDEALARQIVAFLTRSGIPALHEGDGMSAVETVRQRRPDVVVMDIDMPGMDGVEAARIIASEAPQTRLILMSGYIDQMRRANAAGVDVFAIVDKPLPLHMLVRFIRDALGNGRPAAF
jgi:two-component system response regulator AtoC